MQYCSVKQKLETRFLKETGFLASQLSLTEQYWERMGVRPDKMLYSIQNANW